MGSADFFHSRGYAGTSSLPLTTSREAEEKLTGERWKGQFPASYIEEFTQKTGNAKKFHVFVQMLATSLDERSDSVILDLLTYEDLQRLKQKRNSNSTHSAPVNPKRQNSRYLILTYLVEFDRVHYPLQLAYQPRNKEDLQASQAQAEIVNLRIQHRKELERMEKQCNALREENERLIQSEKELRLKLAAVTIELEKYKKQQYKTSHSTNSSGGRSTRKRFDPVAYVEERRRNLELRGRKKSNERTPSLRSRSNSQTRSSSLERGRKSTRSSSLDRTGKRNTSSSRGSSSQRKSIQRNRSVSAERRRSSSAERGSSTPTYAFLTDSAKRKMAKPPVSNSKPPLRRSNSSDRLKPRRSSQTLLEQSTDEEEPRWARKHRRNSSSSSFDNDSRFSQQSLKEKFSKFSGMNSHDTESDDSNLYRTESKKDIKNGYQYSLNGRRSDKDNKWVDSLEESDLSSVEAVSAKLAHLEKMLKQRKQSVI